MPGMDTICVNIHHSIIEVHWKYGTPQEFQWALLQEVCGHEH